MPEEKIYTSMYSRNAELYHHGVKGQKWGIENGPPYPLSSDISTGKRLKKVEKLQKKSEQNREYMKEHEEHYDNKTKKENEKVDKKADKKIDKINKKREFKKDFNETNNYIQLHLNDKGYKYAKEDALKAEIKMKKLLAKENGGKYRYKDMTDEEKEYYRKNVEKKITKAAWVTLLTASAVAGAYEANKLRKPDDYSEYGINRKPSKETRKEIAKGQLDRATIARKESRYGSLAKENSIWARQSAQITQMLKDGRKRELKEIDRSIGWAKKNPNKELADKEIKSLERERAQKIEEWDNRIKKAEDKSRNSYSQLRSTKYT